MASDAVATLVWKEPLTYLFTLREQAALGGDLELLRDTPPSRVQRRELDGLRGARERITFLARALGRSAAPGSAIGEIALPRLGVRFVVVKGTSDAALRKGPGAYDGVGLPGIPGTAAIAGHRTTYGAPFKRIDRLRAGDPITVAMPYATFTYRVERTRIVDPDDVSVLVPEGHDRLVLSACHPLYSAAQRIVVLARLERAVPARTLTQAVLPAARLADRRAAGEGVQGPTTRLKATPTSSDARSTPDHAPLGAYPVTTPPNLSGSRLMRLKDLKHRIDAAAYVVDPALVADAIVRRGALGLLGVSVNPGGARSPTAPADPARRGA